MSYVYVVTEKPGRSITGVFSNFEKAKNACGVPLGNFRGGFRGLIEDSFDYVWVTTNGVEIEIQQFWLES